MDPLWQRAEELFHSALQQPEAAREAWLAAQTGVDPPVRQEARRVDGQFEQAVALKVMAASLTAHRAYHLHHHVALTL